MSFIRNRLYVRILLVVTMLTMQTMVVFPHHHHPDSDRLCFNIAHCTHVDTHDQESINATTEDRCCADCCNALNSNPDSHHRSNGHHACALDDIAVIQPQGERAPQVMIISILPQMTSICEVSSFDKALCAISEQFIRNIRWVGLSTDRQTTEYIVQARPVRAPSFMS